MIVWHWYSLDIDVLGVVPVIILGITLSMTLRLKQVTLNKTVLVALFNRFPKNHFLFQRQCKILGKFTNIDYLPILTIWQNQSATVALVCF